MMRGAREIVAEIALAAQFLTRLRVSAPVWSAARMVRSTRWYPLVGAGVGALSAGAFVAVDALLGPPLAALAAVATALVVTGCLHLDGLADLCDGLGGGRTRDHALAIMRDSRIGTYGVVAIGLVVAAQTLALARTPLEYAATALVGAHAASRASLVLALATSRYARAEGSAGSVSGGPGPGGVALALVLGMAALLPLAAASLGAALAGVAGLASAHVLIRRRYEGRLGGYTGDCLGAVQQTGELGFYLGVAAWL